MCQPRHRVTLLTAAASARGISAQGVVRRQSLFHEGSWNRRVGTGHRWIGVFTSPDPESIDVALAPCQAVGPRQAFACGARPARIRIAG